ncbi:ABC transporter ATP-binding protein [Telmatospirillum siberiense]|uniref:ABC transporter ATP-binding protein n=1 Tax=Telmatospirillum siberiense TaxID=382514 RepID=A0A2N3PQ49_9PROT|nr:ABC transporter ATP-binding protein [Telmatospirillum siberiense]PKU22508.1 ABC transporter ATP-binding protein [Telmatospirillum siberiense]
MSNVSLRNISKSFGGQRVVDGVDIEVHQGELVTLLGPSGCGKTTTLRMIAGLEDADEGSILLGDKVVSDPARGLFLPPERRALSMVFQSYAIWPHMTVFDNVAYPLKVRGRRGDDLRSEVEAALRLVELDALAQRPATAVSGGQQQRVAIARAIVAKPDVLLLDEPLSNLDARLRLKMGEDLRSLQRRTGITALYVTHDQGEALSLSDRVVVMDKGRVLQIGTPEEVYFRPDNLAVSTFFGSPNLFPATVEDCRYLADGLYQLQVRSDLHRGRCLSARAFSTGSPVRVMFRPETFSLIARTVAIGDGDMVFTGQVASAWFRGASRSLVIENGCGRIQAELPATQPVRVGDSITVMSPAEAAWCIADGPSVSQFPCAENSAPFGRQLQDSAP